MPNLKALLEMVDEAHDEIVQFHQDLVRIRTVNTGTMPTGNETEACRYLEQRFSKEGIESETIESAPGRGNFLGHIGTADSPSLLLMSHVDVVTAGDEDRWTYPPFSAHIADGKVYGRGSDDAKSLVSTGAMALFILKRAGVPLQGRLSFLAAADEEAGGNYGVKWLAENVPDKVRADYALNEGSGSPLNVDGKLAYAIAAGEKGRSLANVTARGRAAHAGQPWLGENAVAKMAEVVNRINDYQPELDTSIGFFEQVNQLLNFDSPFTPENIDEIAKDLSGSQKDLSSTLKALSRMTVTPTVITGGTKSNSIPDSSSLICDIRTLPDHSETYVQEQMAKILEGLEDITFELDHTAVSGSSPPDSSFVSHIKKATEIAMDRDDITWLLSVCRGFTDSRFVREIGTAAYGFAPLTSNSDPVRRFHAADEAMEIDNLIMRTKMQAVLACLVLAPGYVD